MLHHLLSLFVISQPVGKYDELVAQKIPDEAVNSTEIPCLPIELGFLIPWLFLLTIENHKLK